MVKYHIVLSSVFFFFFPSPPHLPLYLVLGGKGEFLRVSLLHVRTPTSSLYKVNQVKS